MKKIKRIFANLLYVALVSLSTAYAHAADYCSDDYYIDKTFTNGSRWNMCWEPRDREGIVFHHIFYTPKNETQRMVLNHAAVAQIHVPYDDNGARYHDISDFGIGGDKLLDLQQDECVGGKLLKFFDKHVLCQQTETRNLGYKRGNNSAQQEVLTLFSINEVGAYYYIPSWRFLDDGSIEPWMGVTGALHRFGDNLQHGWQLGDGRIGLSHTHNFYWKLDFDLDGTAYNDQVEEMNFSLIQGIRKRTTTVFDHEISRKVNPDTMRRWRIRDNGTKNTNQHAISYEIELNDIRRQDNGPGSEPFTHNDFYVSVQKNDEKFASHNPGTTKNLAEYVNGESLQQSDLVIWAGISFHHIPRSEDDPHMDAHWSHMRLISRDWQNENPKSEVQNTPPQIPSLVDQRSETGEIISLKILARDIDGDAISYFASGLPSGLQIDRKSGVISGKLASSETDNYNIQLTVSDDKDSSNAQFRWEVVQSETDVGGTGSTSSGGGTVSPGWLFLLGFYIVTLRRFNLRVFMKFYAY